MKRFGGIGGMAGREPDYLMRFRNRWTRLDWAALDTNPVVAPDGLSDVLRAVAYVEGHVAVETRKIVMAGLHRHDDIMGFLPLWVADEMDHARAMAALLRSAAISPQRMSVSLLARGRAVMSPVACFTARLIPGLDLAFLCLGAIAEYVTAETYRALATHFEGPANAVLREIAKQELKHMTFYLAAAKSRCRTPGPHIQCARLMLLMIWRPVGIDDFGVSEWLRLFHPLLADGNFVQRVSRVDMIMDSIAATRDLQLMNRFLSRHQLM